MTTTYPIRTAQLLLAACLAAAIGAGCSSQDVNENEPASPNSENTTSGSGTPSSTEPAYITVDHILIGVSHPKLEHVERTAQDARRLAYELKMRIDGGEDWHALKKEFSDDRSSKGVGGPYAMSNNGHSPRNRNETPRKKMVRAFGDVGFELEVGGIGMADYDPDTSKYGYHIIKRVK